MLLAVEVCSFAQNNSTLYRGRYPKTYSYKYNGTYFWDRKEYSAGNIMYNGKYYENVLLNVDAHSQNLQAITEENALPVLLDRNQVQWFQWKDGLFVNLQYLGFEGAPVGFFKVEKDCDVILLQQVLKNYRDNTRNQNGSGIGYYDDNYDTSVTNYFEKEVQYFAIYGNTVQRITRRKYRKLLSSASGEPRLQTLMNSWHSDDPPSGTLSPIAGRIGGIGLPDGYFDNTLKDIEDSEYTPDALQATYRNKIYVIGEPAQGVEKAVLKGRITDKESGRPLPGAIIFDENTETYTRSDKKGLYVLELPVGDNIVHFSEETKEEAPLRIRLQGNGELNVELSERIEVLKEAVISASSMENHRRTAMGVESVNIKTMGKIPTAFGEGDILRAAMTLPGIKSVGEASGGFNVRGGAADENLILLNDNTIYNPSHLFGIFSAFNPDITDRVDIYKASIPAEYGGRLSSVISVDGKEGDMQRLRGSLGIGVVTGRLHLEGPIVKNKTSFIIGGRTTYSDWILKRLPRSSAYAGAQAGFTDFNAGLTHRFSAKSTLQASFYMSDDTFSMADSVANRFGNINASLMFRHNNPGGNSFRLSAGFDRYTNKTGEHGWKYSAYDVTTQINQTFFRGSWKRTIDSHTLNAGAHVVGYGMAPGIMEPFGESSAVTPVTMPLEYALEPSLFVSDSWQITTAFSIDGGVRLSSIYTFKDNTFYAGPEFRLAAKYSPSETLSFKGGVQNMRQYIHLISNTTGISPLDTWKLSDADIRPSQGYQGAGGVYWTHVGWGLDFSAEAYYKYSTSLLDYKTGAQLAMNPELSKDLIPVYGRSYGIELMAKKPTGSLSGWVSYSYSRAKLREMNPVGTASIAGGKWYNAPHDKPHEFKLAANWAITHRYSFSANVDYSTGRPVTVPVGYYYYQDRPAIAYSQRNSHRIPDYFRVDAAFNIDPGHYLKALAHASITIGVYNLLGRKNPYSVYFNLQGGTPQGYMLSVFATQVPYASLNILF